MENDNISDLTVNENILAGKEGSNDFRDKWIELYAKHSSLDSAQSAS